jgi:hypothetical protein
MPVLKIQPVASKSHKTTKKTIAPKAVKAPKTVKATRIEAPIDPRLQRVFDALDETWHDEANGGTRDYTGLAKALFESSVFTHLILNESVKRGLAVFVEAAGLDTDVALDEMVELVEADHRAYCTCCAARHATEVQS